MPTPAELARRAATSPGAFVPRTVEEADAEFDRLVRSGIPEAEADAILNQRLAPPSAWGEAVSQGLDFATRLGGNALDMGKALATAPITIPLAAMGRARELWNGEAPANPLSPEVQRGFEVAKGEFQRRNLGAGAAQATRSTMDALGLPATRAYESLAQGQYGSAAADLLTMGAQVAGPKAPVATARAANTALLGIPGKVGSLTAKGVGKVLPRRGPVLSTPAPATPTLPTYLDGTATAYLPPTVVAKGAPLPPAKALPAAQQGAAMNALMRQRRAADLAELEAARAPIIDAFASQVAPARIAQAADDFAAQVSPRDQALLARGNAYGTRAAELEAMGPALDKLFRGAEQQSVRHTVGRNLDTAQHARLGTEVARADAGRRGQWHDIRQPLPPKADALQLREALARREALGSLTTTATRESDLLRRLTADMAQSVEALKAARAQGDPIAVARAMRAAEQAKAALDTAKDGSLFIRNARP